MSWYGLLSILRDSAEEIRTWKRLPPQACPNDGEPLRTGHMAVGTQAPPIAAQQA